jgi:biopolymer transport protein ExbB
MSCRCMALLIVTLFASWLGAAEIDVRQAADNARKLAETALAGERTRIIEERSAQVARLNEAVRTLAATRERLLAAQAEVEQLRNTLVGARTVQAAKAQLLEQQLTRAAALLHLELAGLAPGERVQAVTTAVAALPDTVQAQAQVRVAPETIQDRNGATVTVPVMRIATARALAGGDTPATRGALTAKGGLSLIAGPPLPAHVEAALADPASVVIDVAGTWATQPPVVRRTLGEWIAGGRLFIWPILGVGVLGLLIASTRSLALARLPLARTRIDAVLAWMAGDRSAAAPIDAQSAQPLERILAVGVATVGLARAEREAALDRAVLSEAPPLQRGLALLLLLASIAPLLGLLGTVTGMIDFFTVIGAQGSGNARSLSGGISEALITTQAGMFVAVPLLVAHALLSRAAERRILLLEEAASGLLGTAALEGEGS